MICGEMPSFFPQLDPKRADNIIYFWEVGWVIVVILLQRLIHFRRRYPVVSVALRSGTNKDVEDYLQTHHYQFTTVNDPQGKITDQWQVNVTPTIILLNKGKNGFGHNGLDELPGA